MSVLLDGIIKSRLKKQQAYPTLPSKVVWEKSHLKMKSKTSATTDDLLFESTQSAQPGHPVQESLNSPQESIVLPNSRSTYSIAFKEKLEIDSCPNADESKDDSVQLVA